jgi:hypothetical protein
MLLRYLLAHRSCTIGLTCLLAACGGSGGSGTSPPTPVEPTPTPPVITLSDVAMSFSGTAGAASPLPRTVQLTNGGGGTLSGLSSAVTYGAGQPATWLTSTLSATTAPATLTIEASTGSLAAGNYTATVEVRSGLANVASKQVAVTFAMAAAPTGWVALETATSFKAFPPRFVRLAADDQRIAVFYGYRDPGLSILEKGEVVEWRRGTGTWTAARYTTNDAASSPDAAIAGTNGVAVVFDNDGLDVVGALIDDSRGQFGLGFGSLENQTNPSVAGALGTAFFSFIINGRLHVHYSYAHAQSTTLPELSGGLGQMSGACVLTLNCILNASIGGDADAWYAAMLESAGCITVQKGTRTGITYLGPCVRVAQPPSGVQIRVRAGKPTMVFREGTSLYVAEWNGSGWNVVGSGTVNSTTAVRIAVGGAKLAVLTMDATGPAPRVHVDSYDGTSWSAFPDGIEAAGSTLSDVDLAVHQGNAAVALLQSGKITILRYVSPIAPTVATRWVMRPAPGVPRLGAVRGGG